MGTASPPARRSARLYLPVSGLASQPASKRTSSVFWCQVIRLFRNEPTINLWSANGYRSSNLMGEQRRANCLACFRVLPLLYYDSPNVNMFNFIQFSTSPMFLLKATGQKGCYLKNGMTLTHRLPQRISWMASRSRPSQEAKS